MGKGFKRSIAAACFLGASGLTYDEINTISDKTPEDVAAFYTARDRAEYNGLKMATEKRGPVYETINAECQKLSKKEPFVWGAGALFHEPKTDTEIKVSYNFCMDKEINGRIRELEKEISEVPSPEMATQSYKEFQINGLQNFLLLCLGIGGVLSLSAGMAFRESFKDRAREKLLSSETDSLLSPREYFQAALKGLDKLDPEERAKLVNDVLMLAAAELNTSAGKAMTAAHQAQQEADILLEAKKRHLSEIEDAIGVSRKYLEKLFPDATDAFWEELRKAAAADLAGERPLLTGMVHKNEPSGP